MKKIILFSIILFLLPIAFASITSDLENMTIAAYHFDNLTDDMLIDDSVFGFDLNCKGVVLTTGVNGSGGDFEISDNTDYCTGRLNEQPQWNSTEISFSYWMKQESATDNQIILSTVLNWDTSGYTGGWTSYSDDASPNHHLTMADTGAASLQEIGVYTANIGTEWQHVIQCMKSGDHDLYYNNTLKNSQSDVDTDFYYENSNFTIGTYYPAFHRHYDGVLDNLYIFNSIDICSNESLRTFLFEGGLLFTETPPSAPSVPSFTFPSENFDIDNYNINFTFSSTDIPGDNITYYLYINYSTPDMKLVYSGTNPDFTATFPNDGLYNFTAYACDDGLLCSANATTWSFTLDTINPVITMTLPANLTTYANRFENFIYQTQASDTNIYLLNISLFDSTGNITFSEINDTPNDNILTLDGELDISSYTNGTYYVNITATDSHTFGDLRNLTYSYSDATLSFFKETNPSKSLDLEFGYYNAGEVNKITPELISTFDIKPFIKKIDNEYHFGMVFDLPSAEFRFGWRQPKISGLKLYDITNAHYIWRNEYYVDYDASVCKFNAGVLTECRDGQPTVLSTPSYDYIYYNYDLRNWYTPGDRLVFFTKSIGGLNIVTETYTLYFDGCSYIGGNWNVNSYCIFDGETFNIDGNLTFLAGGSFNMTDTKLNFNSTDQWIIFENQANATVMDWYGYSQMN